jgi:hypothetical protein
MAKKPTPIDTKSEDFKKLLSLQKRHNLVTRALGKLQNELDAVHQDWLLKIVDDAVAAVTEQEQIETEAEVLCRQHAGDWFAGRQSIKTPLGEAKFHRSTGLDVPSDELSLVLVEKSNGNELVPGEKFISNDYVRTKTTLNLDALGTLPDAALAALKIKRVEKESFSLKPASVDLGDAVQEKKDEGKKS